MRVILLRHGKVLVEWKKRYSSAGYDAENARYDGAPIEPLRSMDFGISRVYVSRLSRSADTAAYIHGASVVEVCPLLDEVPIRSFRESERELPTWLWNLGATLQWLAGSPRQKEGAAGTRARAEAFLDLLESRAEDAVVVGHGIFFYILMKRMKSRGYAGKTKRYMRNAEALEFHLARSGNLGGRA